MADEILYAGIADLRMSEVLSSEFLLLMASREALPMHPALIYAGDAMGRGSVAIKVSELGLMGYDLLASAADGASVANTALTDGSVTVTPSRQTKFYEASDLARFIDGRGLLQASMFAADAVASAATTLLSLVANVTDDFASSVGSTGVNITVANFAAGVNLLEVGNVPGPYLSILHPVQIGDLRSELLTSSAGAIQWMAASQQQIQLIGNGARGQFLGVDMFSTGLVPTKNSGADRGGAVFGRGCVVWGDSSVDTEGDPNRLAIGGKVLFERVRTGRSGLTAYGSTVYQAASIGIDAGVSIITDA